jgi:hypothetical protein
MDFLEFNDVSFLPNVSIRKLCEDLNTTVEQGIWYDKIQAQNKKVVTTSEYDFVTTTNSNNVLCAHLDYFQVM